MAVKKTIKKAKSDIMSKAKGLLKTGKKKLEEMEIDPAWKRLKEELERAAEAVGKGTGKAAEKALNLASRAGVEYHIYEHERKMEKLYAKLGSRTYELLQRSPERLNAADPDIVEITAKIADMETRIGALKEKAAALRKQ